MRDVEVVHAGWRVLRPATVLLTRQFRVAAHAGPGGGLPGEGEDVETLELVFTEAMAMVRDGRITDARTIVLLQWAALDGPLADHPRR